MFWLFYIFHCHHLGILLQLQISKKLWVMMKCVRWRWWGGGVLEGEVTWWCGEGVVELCVEGRWRDGGGGHWCQGQATVFPQLSRQRFHSRSRGGTNRAQEQHQHMTSTNTWTAQAHEQHQHTNSTSTRTASAYEQHEHTKRKGIFFFI